MNLPPDQTQLCHVPHRHQQVPVVYCNGKTSIFSGDCSSQATTRLLMDHMRHEHYFTIQHHFGYPPSRALKAYRRKWRERMGRRLARFCIEAAGEGKVDLVAHSMGCLISYYAMAQLRGYIRRFVFLSPAMRARVDWDFVDFEHGLVLTNEQDRALFWGAFFPGHPFGVRSAGRRGFDFGEEKIVHVDVPDKAKADFHRHSHYFREPAIHDVGFLVEDFLTGERPDEC